MKNLFLFFALVFTTSLISAQDLTPDMLVGEYEGEVHILYEGSSEPTIDKKATLEILKLNDGDTLLLNYYADEAKYDVKAILNDSKQLLIFHDKVEDKEIFIKYTKANNYQGENIKSTEYGTYDLSKKLLIVSFVRISSFSDTPETATKYFYFEMKKK